MLRGMVLFCVFIATAIPVATGESHLMRMADVSSDRIVFTYESDLWLAPIEGGLAHRITRSDGGEVFAKFSPDGSKVAFSASYDGGLDVYVMDVNGSAPAQLTYHPAADLVLGWFPDGEHILFRSAREYPRRADLLYKVSVNGGMPEKLPVDRGGLASLSPTGQYIAYNRNSRESRTWKRHKGGTAQDIWMGALDTEDFQKITEFDGTDNFPMWHGDFIYFTSDRADGTMNLFKFAVEGGEITQLTTYNDYDVKYPSLGDKHIIYQYEETLYLFDLETEKSAAVEIEIPSDGVMVRSAFIDAPRFVGAFNLSPQGNRAVLDIRGEIINMPTDEGVIYNLTQTSGTREKNPAWSPDGKWVAFLSDKSGEEEIYLAEPNGDGKWKRLTMDGHGWRDRLVWSPDSKHLLFHDKFMRLNMAHTESDKISVVDTGDYDDGWHNWGIQDYAWSPDSRWVAYSKLEQSMYQSVFLYSMDTGKSYRVTSPMTQDWSPSFSLDGKYLYFLSNRDFNPVMGFVDQNHIFLDMTRPYYLILKEGDPAPFRPKNVFDEVAKDEEKKEDEEKPRSEFLQVTLENFADRILAAPVEPGNLFRLEAVKGGFLFLRKTEGEFIKYQVVNDSTAAPVHDLCKFDMEEGEDSRLMAGISQYHVSPDGKKLIYKAGGSYGVVKLGKAKVGDGRLNLSDVQIKVDRNEEFVQIFNEAWRVQRDWFYDKDMHGLNWEKVGEKYRRFIPFCGTRGDVNYLIGEMIAELNAGHTYVYGGDSPRRRGIGIGMFGAEIACEEDSYPQIKRIIASDDMDPDARSPFAEPGCPVKVGHYIFAIDGVKIERGDNIYKYLQNKGGKVIEITYGETTDVEDAQKYLVETLRSEGNLRYREWVRHNREYVDAQSGGEIGYVHIPGMMENGLTEFARAFYPQHYKNGLIVDVRYNGGGFTSKQIIDRLERRINTMDQPREGKPSPTPERTFRGYLVLLFNRDTGSDGEIFSEAWKIRGFGPAIGQRTWGGAVGIENHQPLIDGGATTPPQFGHYNMDRKWSIEGHGVVPDIEVVNMPAEVLKGVDAQLDRGIEVLKQMFAEKPIVIPDHPPYLDKSKRTLR